MTAFGVGVLHMPFAQSFLARVGDCPMAGSKLTVDQMETARHIGTESVRGSRRASALPSVSHSTRRRRETFAPGLLGSGSNAKNR